MNMESNISNLVIDTKISDYFRTRGNFFPWEDQRVQPDRSMDCLSTINLGDSVAMAKDETSNECFLVRRLEDFVRTLAERKSGGVLVYVSEGMQQTHKRYVPCLTYRHDPAQ